MERRSDIAALVYNVCGVTTILYAPGTTPAEKVAISEFCKDIAPPRFVFWDELSD